MPSMKGPDRKLRPTNAATCCGASRTRSSSPGTRAPSPALSSRDTVKRLVASEYDIDDVAHCFRCFGRLVASEADRVLDTGREDVDGRPVYEPVGVCGLIRPWNYPLLQTAWKLPRPSGRQHLRAQADGGRRADGEGGGPRLGGRNPDIVFTDADFDAAVDMALTAVFLHSGGVLGRGAAARGGLAARLVGRRGRTTGAGHPAGRAVRRVGPDRPLI